jgi:CheY-like chemotaxis protein
MSHAPPFRILVIDDNPMIHRDFKKILGGSTPQEDAFEQAETLLFGAENKEGKRLDFAIDSAFQGAEGLSLVQTACVSHRPYALAFVDVRMPPGWDGVETTARIWNSDPNLQVVICTAYADYSWEEMLARLQHSDRFLILKKPFDAMEVIQLARSLTTKWLLARQAQLRLDELVEMVQERTRSLQEALANVRTLNGLLPICAACKKIRDDNGYWQRVESFVQKHSEAQFTHGMCPECVKKWYPEIDLDSSPDG